MVSYHFSFHKKLLRPKKGLDYGEEPSDVHVQRTGADYRCVQGGTGSWGISYCLQRAHGPFRARSYSDLRCHQEVGGGNGTKRDGCENRGERYRSDAPQKLSSFAWFLRRGPSPASSVREFLKNGTLASYLFHGDPKPRWNDRLRIASGIASGLAYLHEECISKIMHCDVKPENVLLDDTFNPKISDFGLAKLMRMDQTRTSTGFRGTRGYVAPEWYRKIPVTVKVDVYSFGIMLLETVCCRRNVEMERGRDERVILLDWAYRCYEERQMEKLVEEDEEAKQEVSKLERVVKVAMWCVQEEPSLRPAMHKVVQMLEGAVEVPSPPHPSSFLSALG